jgi:hypothetical protein
MMMSKNEKPAILYINGLGDGKTKLRQRLVLANMNWHGYQYWHAHVNWLSDESFQDHLRKTSELAQGLLTAKGRLAIVGSSAGASMAFNIFGKLAAQNRDLWAISLCGRTSEGQLPKWDWRTLEWAAHLGKAKQSQSFYDSVKYCEQETLPGLNHEQRQRLFINHQLFDLVVPNSTQLVNDVPESKLPVLGHGLGILAAGFMLPSTVSKHTGR